LSEAPHIPGRRLVVAFAAVILSLVTIGGMAQVATPPLAPERVVERMEERSELQHLSLHFLEDRRRYFLTHPLLGNPALLVVQETYHAPDEKQFEVLERSGSSLVQKRVFAKLLEVEQASAHEAERLRVSLTRANYEFLFQDFDAAAAAYIFAVRPRTENPYLFVGKVWIDAADFGVKRIEGQPAHRHSIWIRRTRFVHEFAPFGKFWFPVRHRSETELRLFGKAVLEIEYSDYAWQPSEEVEP
jgi:hypothetical protein